MQAVSMLELRQHAAMVLDRVRAGQTLVLTYRGEQVARLEPISHEVAESDSFYSLAKKADENAPAMTNRQIDEVVYEQT